MNGGLVLLVVALVVVGLGLLVLAMVLAGHADVPAQVRAQVVGGLSGGIITGAAVAVGVLLLQQQLTASSAYTLWRTTVENSADIPGFNPGDYPLQGLDLSAKQLQDADLRGKDLRDVQFRDTDLADALLGGANLHDDVMWSANLTGAELPGADLSGAQIQGANFDHARIADIKSLDGATANLYTCWPADFFKLPIAREVKAGENHDALGRVTWSRGREYPHCLTPPP